MSAHPQTHYTADAYLALERRAEQRSEYLAGEIIAMTGASRRHNLIVVNLAACLRHQARAAGCEIYVSDMRVHVPAADLFTYPDLAAAGGEPVFDDAQLDTLLNPVLLIEVLSPSTEDYDRGRKFAFYRTLPSLRDYLLVAQDRVHVEHFVRQDEGEWLLSETDDPAATIALPALGAEITVREIYDGVPGLVAESTR